jgi:hypothetical protein
MQPRVLHLSSRPVFPLTQVKEEEGRIHLLIHLPSEEENEERRCLWRPDQAGFDSRSATTLTVTRPLNSMASDACSYPCPNISTKVTNSEQQRVTISSQNNRSATTNANARSRSRRKLCARCRSRNLQLLRGHVRRHIGKQRRAQIAFTSVG